MTRKTVVLMLMFAWLASCWAGCLSDVYAEAHCADHNLPPASAHAHGQTEEATVHSHDPADPTRVPLPFESISCDFPTMPPSGVSLANMELIEYVVGVPYSLIPSDIARDALLSGRAPPGPTEIHLTSQPNKAPPILLS